MDVEAGKREMRRNIRSRLAGISDTEAAEAARRVEGHLFEAFDFAGFGPARRVALYAAMPDELPTRALFEALVAAGVACCLPRTTAAGRLEFAAVGSFAELETAELGIPTPAAAAPLVELGRRDLVLVPGRAFDRSGARLGRGRAYYDRTFPVGRSDTPELVGIAYAVQLLETVPIASHDRAMDAIVTEHGFCRVQGGPR